MHLSWLLGVDYVGVTGGKYTTTCEIQKDTPWFSLGGFMKMWSN